MRLDNLTLQFLYVEPSILDLMLYSVPFVTTCCEYSAGSESIELPQEHNAKSIVSRNKFLIFFIIYEFTIITHHSCLLISIVFKQHYVANEFAMSKISLSLVVQ